MFKCFIGIGILATPSAIRQVGVVGGGVGILICGLINMYTMKLQIACKEKMGP
jgi:amino acid permease